MSTDAARNVKPFRGDDPPPLFRELPHNIDAEQALLGAILVNNATFDRVDGEITAADFFDPLHAQIFDVVVALVRSGRRADPISLKVTFESHLPIEPGLSVPLYLGRLMAGATTIINARDYARTVRDLAVRRRLIEIGTDIVNTAFEATVEQTPEIQIEFAEQQLFGVAPRHRAPSGGGLDAACTGVLKTMRDARARGARLAGLSTGLVDVDVALGGLRPGDLLVIAARPSMGKTALATKMAFYNADLHRRSNGKEGGSVVFFSLEMPREQIATRILSDQASLNSRKIVIGDLTDEEEGKVAGTAERIASAPLWIEDASALSIGTLATRARRLARRGKLGLIVVDYIQLLSGTRRDNRVQEVTEITTGLKALALELKVPIIALSQLSRAPEQRQDKRPQLSDLRESGSIEQDADVVMFVFREEYYVEREEPSMSNASAHIDWRTRLSACANKADIIIAKSRHGPTAVVPVAFFDTFARFANLARGGGQ